MSFSQENSSNALCNREIQGIYHATTSSSPPRLLSVSDKAGIVEFAQALSARGVELLSTGGTARLLADKGLR